ncbi:hypothetical protein GLX27_004243 [Malassezia furfur]|uniref:Uncharacterized protein n=1 Tax=Malassezia furfur TaxID=55194 RepID=A0ABY8EYL9_MALFU|nr:hypothetical protein GLX27_004243 [Malassezia furfur]
MLELYDVREDAESARRSDTSPSSGRACGADACRAPGGRRTGASSSPGGARAVSCPSDALRRSDV